MSYIEKRNIFSGKAEKHKKNKLKSLDKVSRKNKIKPKIITKIGYHGTFADFEKFEKSKLGSNTEATSAFEGFFFASNKKVAESYASDLTKRLKSQGISAEKAIEELKNLTGDSYFTVLKKYRLQEYSKDIDEKVDKLLEIIQEKDDLEAGIEDMPMAYDSVLDETGKLKKSRLIMRKPFIYDMEGKEYREISYAELIKKAKSLGYDSVIIKNTYDGGNPVANYELTDIYVVFDEEQIEVL